MGHGGEEEEEEGRGGQCVSSTHKELGGGGGGGGGVSIPNTECKSAENSVYNLFRKGINYFGIIYPEDKLFRNRLSGG